MTTRSVFFIIWASYETILQCTIFNKLKVYERGTFSVKMVDKKNGVGPWSLASPYKTWHGLPDILSYED